MENQLGKTYKQTTTATRKTKAKKNAKSSNNKKSYTLPAQPIFLKNFSKKKICFYSKNLCIKHYPSTLENDVIYSEPFLWKSHCFH